MLAAPTDILVDADGGLLAYPRLLWPPQSNALLQSSPHLVTLGWIRDHYGCGPKRQSLLDSLERRLAELRAHHIAPSAMLMGGSFVSDKAEPGDIDALVAYRLVEGDSPSQAARALIRKASDGLDLRFVPDDAGPVMLFKLCCFFHTMYQRIDGDHVRGCLLVDLLDNDLEHNIQQGDER